MQVERIHRGSWGKIRAFVDIKTDEGFTLKGFKLIEGAEGLFVGFPSQKGNDGEYYDTVWAEKELRGQLNTMVISAYSEADESPGISDDDIPF